MSPRALLFLALLLPAGAALSQEPGQPEAPPPAKPAPVPTAENITRFLRFSAGVGYRYVGSVNLTALRQEDVSGFTGSVTLKFGRF